MNKAAYGKRFTVVMIVAALSAATAMGCAGGALTTREKAAGWEKLKWEKLKWEGIPKTKDGAPRNTGKVGIVGKNNVWFSFSGDNLAHWDGKSFKAFKYEKPGKRADIRNFVINSEKDIWAFGDNGLSLHYDGSKWKNVKNPLTGKGRREGRLWGSGCPTPKKCFSGSRSGDLVEWDGSSWKFAAKAGEPPAEGARIYAMQFPSKNLGYMAGEAFFAKWDGKAWKKLDVEAPRMYDMSLLSKDYGWAVGDGGAFFKFDGKTFTRVNVKGSFFRMRGVGCLSKDNCWAVGDAGAAFNWDGKGWKKVKMGTFDRLNSVRFGHGHGFIVGQKGLILQSK